MKYLFSAILTVLLMNVSAQVKIQTSFPIMTDGRTMLWKEYDKAKNVKIESSESFSFDLNGTHYKVASYSNGVKTIKKKGSETTANPNGRDSIKIFLLPSYYLEQKVIVVQITYFYDKSSLKLNGLDMVPLMYYRDLQAAKKVYHLPQ